MVALESLQHTAFTPLLGNVFTVKTGVGAELRLQEVKQLGHKRVDAMRDPFSLLFRGPPGLRIEQGIHRLESKALGAMDIFITQVGSGPQGADFEAVFT